MRGVAEETLEGEQTWAKLGFCNKVSAGGGRPRVAADETLFAGGETPKDAIESREEGGARTQRARRILDGGRNGVGTSAMACGHLCRRPMRQGCKTSEIELAPKLFKGVAVRLLQRRTVCGGAHIATFKGCHGRGSVDGIGR
ncbi:hypothetical protein Salat_2149300 [Sesamum alatum]|uniref:Uncharacterized protein n=1 Tax=Sesamum alatum TaxID=300844 RepID=A0AAE2CH28_9LAMI|nr:hypothetical protein Salat_2149300 [Sesamum alatum]